MFKSLLFIYGFKKITLKKRLFLRSPLSPLSRRFSRSIWGFLIAFSILNIATVARAKSLLLQRQGSNGLAQTLSTGHTEVGAFGAVRYGLSDDLELQGHPLIALLAPALTLKKRWRVGEKQKWLLSSKHGLSFPSGLFKLVAREGTGGLLSKESVVPHMIGFNNTLILGIAMGETGVLTLTASLNFGARAGEMNLDTLDLPFLYQRTAMYHKGWATRFGVDYDYALSQQLRLTVDLDYWYFAAVTGNWAIEHKTMLTWVFKSTDFSTSDQAKILSTAAKRQTQTIAVMAGYKYIYGAYPFGAELNLGNNKFPFPLIDIVWSW